MATKFPHKCPVKFCRNLVRESNHSDVCAKHASQRFKENHPLRYSYNKLKQRAKERGKVFTLTDEYYEALAVLSGYADQRGKSADSLSLDRIDNRLGYIEGNVRVITLSENARKWTRMEFANIPGWMREEMRAAVAA